MDKIRTEAQVTPDNPDTERTRARYNRTSRFYDALYWPGEKLVVRKLRRLVWERVPAGSLLEVGVGTGENFSFHPAEATITGIDISPGMLMKARRKYDHSRAELELIDADVQALPFPDDHFENAVATFVFCSVPEPELGLREVSRVVRPGGRIFLLEHVRLDFPVIGRMMDMADPLAVRVMGAHINRRTGRMVREAGIGRVSEERRGPFGIIRILEIENEKE